jgi:D-glycero-alpha-D-manno-heptose-7-phosphate kinase
MKPFLEGVFLKYSKMEKVRSVAEVEHPIIRATLEMMSFDAPQIEITTLADIPSGTGLGSSGSFTTALIKALHAHQRKHLSPQATAELACDVEIQRLREPIGKQDQYIAAMGGLCVFNFNQDGSVSSENLNISHEAYEQLEDNLLLFFTGYARSASNILKDQKIRTNEDDEAMLANLHSVKKIGQQSLEALQSGDIPAFGELMHTHWESKKQRSGGMSNAKIDKWYKIARENGAIGGKLVGAGGGGFLMFLAQDKMKLRAAMKGIGLSEVRFRFDLQGTKVLVAE